MADEHERPPVDGTDEKIRSLLDYANHLDLHGVFIVSPPCPACGQLHHFSLVTDVPDTAEQNVSELLRHFADHCENPATPPTTFHKTQRTPPQ